MAETQDELKIEIGTEEAVTLKPATVKIVDVRIEEVGIKNSKKVVCSVKHPAKEETIKISSVKWESKGNLEVSGLWVNKDSKDLLRKGSALVNFLVKQNARNIEQLKDKEIPTVEDDAGYLVFKAY